MASRPIRLLSCSRSDRTLRQSKSKREQLRQSDSSKESYRYRALTRTLLRRSGPESARTSLQAMLNSWRYIAITLIDPVTGGSECYGLISSVNAVSHRVHLVFCAVATNFAPQLFEHHSFRLHSHDPTRGWAISSIPYLRYTNYCVTVFCSRVTWVCANS